MMMLFDARADASTISLIRWHRCWSYTITALDNTLYVAHVSMRSMIAQELLAYMT